MRSVVRSAYRADWPGRARSAWPQASTVAPWLLAAIDDQHDGADHQKQGNDVPDIGPRRLAQRDRAESSSRGRAFDRRTCKASKFAVETPEKIRDRPTNGVIGRIGDELVVGRYRKVGVEL